MSGCMGTDERRPDNRTGPIKSPLDFICNGPTRRARKVSGGATRSICPPSSGPPRLFCDVPVGTSDGPLVRITRSTLKALCLLVTLAGRPADRGSQFATSVACVRIYPAAKMGQEQTSKRASECELVMELRNGRTCHRGRDSNLQGRLKTFPPEWPNPRHHEQVRGVK